MTAARSVFDPLFPADAPVPVRSEDGLSVTARAPGSSRYAVFSSEAPRAGFDWWDVRYRYELSDAVNPRSAVEGTTGEALFVLTNPSTASHLEDDPTSRKVAALARRAGMSRWTIANPFAFRGTRPEDLSVAKDPVGPACDALLLAAARRARIVVLGWGPPTKAGAAFASVFRARTAAVCAMLAGEGIATHAYAVTKDGSPGHPLFLPSGSPLLPYPPLSAAAGRR